MKKYQEALKWFKSIFQEIGTEQYYENLGLRFGQGLNESIETIEELVDKEIPMKPLKQYPIDFGLGNYGDCRICNCGVNYQQNYCNNCGQKIDWSEEND